MEKKPSTDVDTHIVAQKMIWQEVNGYTLHSIKRLNGSAVNIATIEAKKSIKPLPIIRRNQASIIVRLKIVLGQSTTMTDTNNLNLSEFDEVVEKYRKH